MNKIHIKTFDLEGEYIELTSLLKVMNLTQTGGQAGLLVVDGLVKLNGNQESRKRAKIRSGDVITIDNIKILVK